jgi:hypothetical protein
MAVNYTPEALCIFTDYKNLSKIQITELGDKVDSISVFLFERSKVIISARKPANVTEDYRGFTLYLQTNYRITPQFIP